MLDTRREDESELDGVVLLDLPDHDSTEVAHHLEVDRLVDLADVLIWVLDPQKYADAAIHDRYLAQSVEHQDVMLVALNHIDTVPEERRESMLGVVRRLLDADGLDRVPVLPVSAKDGTGVAELKAEIARRAAEKQSTRIRLDADVRTVAAKLRDASGEAPTRVLSAERVAALDDSFADAAGVPTVVEAVERSTRMQVGRATGWPIIGWLSGMKPDPVKALQLDLGTDGRQLAGRGRSMPEATQVQRARVDTEVRALADDVSAGLGRPWVEAVRRASTSRLDELGDRLDAALAAAQVSAGRTPWWAHVVRLLQWALVLAAVAGLAWTGVLLGTDKLQDPETPQVAGVALPLVLLVGGLALGIVIGLLCRLRVRSIARRRADAVDDRLREGVREVSHELVVDPIEVELAAYSSLRTALGRVLDS
jgi:hypothetical protein